MPARLRIIIAAAVAFVLQIKKTFICATVSAGVSSARRISDGGILQYPYVGQAVWSCLTEGLFFRVLTPIVVYMASHLGDFEGILPGPQKYVE